MRQPKNVRVSAYAQECAERLLLDRHYPMEEDGERTCSDCESYWPCDTAWVALAVLERDP